MRLASIELNKHTLAKGIAISAAMFVTANAFVTYQGALVATGNFVLAICFSGAAQIAVLTSLLAYPHVSGYGKVALMVVYLTGVAVSTSFAYIEVFDASTSSVENSQRLDRYVQNLGLKMRDIYAFENERLAALGYQVAQISNEVEKEKNSGMVSGKGPGEGPVYYSLLAESGNLEAQYQVEKERFDAFVNLYKSIQSDLSSSDGSYEDQRGIYLKVLEWQSMAVAQESRSVEIEGPDVGSGRARALDRAIDSIVDIDEQWKTVGTSVIWAMVLDVLALCLGVVRSYLLAPSRNVLERLAKFVEETTMGVLNVKNAMIDGKRRFAHERGMRERVVAIDHIVLYRFLCELFAAEGKTTEDGSCTDFPIVRGILSKIKPLNCQDYPGRRGIEYDQLTHENGVGSVMGTFVSLGVFEEDYDLQVYLVNEENANGLNISIVSGLLVYGADKFQKWMLESKQMALIGTT